MKSRYISSKGVNLLICSPSQPLPLIFDEVYASLDGFLLYQVDSINKQNVVIALTVYITLINDAPCPSSE